VGTTIDRSPTEQGSSATTTASLADRRKGIGLGMEVSGGPGTLAEPHRSDWRADFEFHPIGVAEEEPPGVTKLADGADVDPGGDEPVADLVEVGAGRDGDAVVVDRVTTARFASVPSDCAC
jgi:hypothetical protein